MILRFIARGKGSEKMEEQVPARQNRLTVHYQDDHGNVLNEDLSIFGAVGSTYKINAPVMRGFRLIETSQPLTGEMPAAEKAAITLTYQRLGSLIIRGIDDGPQLVSLQVTPGDARTVASVRLPELTGDKKYYIRDNDLRLVESPDNFLPDDPTAPTLIQAMTDAEVKRALAPEEAVMPGDSTGDESGTQPSREREKTTQTVAETVAAVNQAAAQAEANRQPATPNAAATPAEPEPAVPSQNQVPQAQPQPVQQPETTQPTSGPQPEGAQPTPAQQPTLAPNPAPQPQPNQGQQPQPTPVQNPAPQSEGAESMPEQQPQSATMPQPAPVQQPATQATPAAPAQATTNSVAGLSRMAARRQAEPRTQRTGRDLRAVVELFIRALAKQTELLELQATQDLLTAQQFATLLEHMHDFLNALAIITESEDA